MYKKINMQKLVTLLLAKSELSTIEIQIAILFIIAKKKTQDFLTPEMKDFYNENYKTFIKL